MFAPIVILPTHVGLQFAMLIKHTFYQTICLSFNKQQCQYDMKYWYFLIHIFSNLNDILNAYYHFIHTAHCLFHVLEEPRRSPLHIWAVATTRKCVVGAHDRNSITWSVFQRKLGSIHHQDAAEILRFITVSTRFYYPSYIHNHYSTTTDT